MGKIRTITETENIQIKEIRTVFSDDDANVLLKEGWIYLNSGTIHKDNMGFNAKGFIRLGRIEQ